MTGPANPTSGECHAGRTGEKGVGGLWVCGVNIGYTEEKGVGDLWVGGVNIGCLAVSYTHLTLPTKLIV